MIVGVIVYCVALVAIPLTFYYLTRWVLAPDIEDPELPEFPEQESVVVMWP
jgi:hypothetical protein